MGTKKLNTEIRQRQILDEALKIVSQQGLEGLSVGKLADRSGLVPSGIYRHFHNKTEIVDTVLGFVNERLIANVEAVCAETPDAEERLYRLLNRHVNLLLENPGIPQVVFSEGIFSSNSTAHTHVIRIIHGYLGKVEQIIRQGQADGHINPGIDPGTVSVMFLGLIIPGIMLSTATSGEFDARNHVERAWSLFSMVLKAGSRKVR
jgi:AcrR family transcriptional regulator